MSKLVIKIQLVFSRCLMIRGYTDELSCVLWLVAWNPEKPWFNGTSSNIKIIVFLFLWWCMLLKCACIIQKWKIEVNYDMQRAFYAHLTSIWMHPWRRVLRGVLWDYHLPKDTRKLMMVGYRSFRVVTHRKLQGISAFQQYLIYIAMANISSSKVVLFSN